MQNLTLLQGLDISNNKLDKLDGLTAILKDLKNLKVGELLVISDSEDSVCYGKSLLSYR